MVPSLRVMAAGSLRRAFVPLMAQFTRRSGIKVSLEFGPAGLLRQRIEDGAAVDLFASANLHHPQALLQRGLAQRVMPFAGNGLCLTLRNTPVLNRKSWLDALLDDRFILAISTPGSDPCGDYAWQLFDNIERRYPGAGLRLKARAKTLVGGVNSQKIPPGEPASAWLIATGLADMFIGYNSYAPLLSQRPNLRIATFPAEFTVSANYMLATFSSRADPLAAYLLSPYGQAWLKAYGFKTVANAALNRSPHQTGRP